MRSAYYCLHRSCIYLYPDLTTVVTGSFSAGSLVSGRMGVVVGVASRDGILVPVVKVDEASAQGFTRDVSNNSRMSSTPLLQDPFERRRVQVGLAAIILHTCSILEWRGEGHNE